jgi:hypothetical protein
MSTRYLTGVPAGLAITARLADGTGALGTVVSVSPWLRHSGEVLGYKATFTEPFSIDPPLELEWLSPALAILDTEVIQHVGAASAGDWFTLDELRAFLPPSPVYADDQLIEARTVAQSALEDACGLSFTPAPFSETLDGPGGSDLYLDTHRVLSIDSVTSAGASVLPAVEFDTDEGLLYNVGGWSFERRDIIVTGVAGYLTPPKRVRRAGLLLAKRYLVVTQVSDRATSHTDSNGATEFLITAGVRGMVFDVPEANAVVQQYGIRKGRMIA